MPLTVHDLFTNESAYFGYRRASVYLWARTIMPQIQTVIPVEEDITNPLQIEVYNEGKEIKEEADKLFRMNQPQKGAN